MEEEVLAYFQQYNRYKQTVTLNSSLADITGSNAESVLASFFETYQVDYSNFRYYAYFEVFDEGMREECPIKISHLVEVAQSKKWFTPIYLSNYLTEDKEIELFVMGFFLTCDLRTTINNQWKQITLDEIVRFMGSEHVDLTGFDYDTWFVKGSWWRHILLSEKKRRPLKASHLIEVVKRKKWFDPI